MTRKMKSQGLRDIEGKVVAGLATLVLAVTLGSNVRAATILDTPHESESHLYEVLADAGYAYAGSTAELNANITLQSTFTAPGSEGIATLLIEDAGYRHGNELGIYSALDPSLMVTLFAGPVSAVSTISLVFDSAGLATVDGVAIDSGFGGEFGFYLRNLEHEFTWYSDSSRNSDDGFVHFVGFEQGDVLYFGFEDLANGGDRDYNDFVGSIGSAPIPEPSAALLFGFGSLSLGAVTRRKFPQR